MAIQFNLQGGGPNPQMADWPSIPAQYGVPVQLARYSSFWGGVSNPC